MVHAERPAVEVAVHDIALLREFAGLSWDSRLHDETTILRFRRLREQHRLAPQILGLVNDLLRDKGLMLSAGNVVYATLISAPSSTKHAGGERDPEMMQSKNGNQWYLGMKAHIDADAESGLVHSVRGTAGSVNDVLIASSLPHGGEAEVWGDASSQGAGKRTDAKPGVRWDIAMRPGRRRHLDKTRLVEGLTDRLERIEASLRAKVEHPLWVIKRQFGHVKLRHLGLKKNTSQLHTLLPRSNLWMARRSLMGAQT